MTSGVGCSHAGPSSASKITPGKPTASAGQELFPTMPLLSDTFFLKVIHLKNRMPDTLLAGHNGGQFYLRARNYQRQYGAVLGIPVENENGVGVNYVIFGLAHSNGYILMFATNNEHLLYDTRLRAYMIKEKEVVPVEFQFDSAYLSSELAAKEGFFRVESNTGEILFYCKSPYDPKTERFNYDVQVFKFDSTVGKMVRIRAKNMSEAVFKKKRDRFYKENGITGLSPSR